MTRQKETRRFFRRKSVLAVNVVLLALIAWGFTGEYLRNREMNNEISQLRTQAQQLESHNLELARLAQQLSDPEAMEKEARLKLDMQKPGEQVVVVKGAPATGPASAAKPNDGTTAGATTSHITNPKKWFLHFFR